SKTWTHAWAASVTSRRPSLVKAKSSTYLNWPSPVPSEPIVRTCSNFTSEACAEDPAARAKAAQKIAPAETNPDRISCLLQNDPANGTASLWSHQKDEIRINGGGDLAASYRPFAGNETRRFGCFPGIFRA